MTFFLNTLFGLFFHNGIFITPYTYYVTGVQLKSSSSLDKDSDKDQSQFDELFN
jgi:hypothetical protein